MRKHVNYARVMAIASVFVLLILATVYLRQHYLISYIKSSSMEPTYYEGDVVIIHKVPPSEIRIGDVIVFREPGGSELILHRVVAIEERDGKRYFLTKGDNPRTNPRVDVWLWVPEENVIGVLVARVPYVGWVFLAFDEPGARLMLVLIIIMFLMLYWSKESEYSNILSPLISHLRSLRTRTMLLFLVLGLILGMYILSIPRGEYAVSVGKRGHAYGVNDRSYVVLEVYVCSKISPVVSISEIHMVISGRVGGEAVWRVVYPFYGEKHVSIAVLLNTSLPPSILNVHVFLVIKNYATGSAQQVDGGSYRVEIIV